jgi:hypothetical protein
MSFPFASIEQAHVAEIDNEALERQTRLDALDHQRHAFEIRGDQLLGEEGDDRGDVGSDLGMPGLVDWDAVRSASSNWRWCQLGTRLGD